MMVRSALCLSSLGNSSSTSIFLPELYKILRGICAVEDNSGQDSRKRIDKRSRGQIQIKSVTSV